jgi:ribonuclease E
MKDNTGAVHLQVPVDVATFLLNEKRHDILSIEARHRVEVVLIPNMHFETPRYTLTRFRHDQLNQTEPLAPSYKMVEKPAEEEETKPRNGGAAKARAGASRWFRASRPTSRPDARRPAPTPVPETGKPGLFGRIFGWLRGMSATEEAARPEPVKKAESRREREPRRGRENREQRERGDRESRERRVEAAPEPVKVEAPAPVVEAAPAPAPIKLPEPDLAAAGLQLVETAAEPVAEAEVETKAQPRRRRSRARAGEQTASEPLVLVETRSEDAGEPEEAMAPPPADWGPPSNPRRRARPKTEEVAAEPLVLVETKAEQRDDTAGA